MIVVGGVLIALVGIISLLMSFGAVGLDAYAALSIFNAVCMLLAGIFIAVSQQKISTLQQKVNSLERKIKQ